MADIAQLGFSADTKGLQDAKAKLDALVPSAAKAESASSKLGLTLGKVDASADKLSQAASGLVAAADKLSKVLDGQANATTRAANAGQSLSVATTKITYNIGAATTALTKNTAAANANAAANAKAAATQRGVTVSSTAFDGIGASTAAASGKTRFASQDDGLTSVAAQTALMRGGVKAIEQEAEAGETALSKFKTGAIVAFGATRDAISGFANKAATFSLLGKGGAAAAEKDVEAIEKVGHSAKGNSTAIRELFTIGREASVGNYTRLAGSLSILAGALGILEAVLPVVVVGLVGLFAAQRTFNNEANKADLTSYANGLGLTSKEMRKLTDDTDHASQIQVTYGDTLKGLFQTVSDLPGVSKGASAALKYITDGFKGLVSDFADLAARLYGTAVGSYNAILKTWQNFPGAFKYLIAIAINGALGDFEKLANGAIDIINKVKPGSAIGHVSVGRISSANDGHEAAAKVAGDFNSEITKATNTARGSINKFYADWEKNSVNASKKRIKTLADEMIANRGKGRTPSTALDGFDKIENAGDNDIAKVNAQAGSYKLTAEAAATLEEKEKLLAQAASQGLKLTDAQVKTIDRLAAAYGAAKVAADNAKSLYDITTGAEKSIVTLKGQGDAIGLVGRQLAYQTEMTNLLAEAESKHLPVTQQVLSTFTALSNKYADASAANENAKYYNDATVAGNEQIDSLKEQLGYIGKSDTAVAGLTEQYKIQNDEKYRGITLNDSQKAALISNAVEQAKLTGQINTTNEAYGLLRDSATGFVTDLQNGLKQGQGFFSAFTNAVTNLLDKVLSKLEDVAINAAFGQTGSGSGGLGGLLGGIGKALGIGGSSLDYSGFNNSTLSSLTASNAAGAGAITFARGDVFGSATGFGFTRNGGAKAGVMGEAGPEAAMPLVRGRDGSLGVQMYGSQQQQPQAPTVNINPVYQISGAVSREEITGAIKAAGDQQAAALRKQVPNIINEYQRNGAL